MEPPSVKQEQLGDEEKRGTLEQLLQCKKEIAQMEERVLAGARRWRLPAAERMGLLQSAVPDTQSKERGVLRTAFTGGSTHGARLGPPSPCSDLTSSSGPAGPARLKWNPRRCNCGW
ncbi:hypothetical protein EOD39_18714 [Acipenser ruthenus]|uniref:Uncharacterized protein n=1 Tax=Acipenser ruthenus TaxID=7906 RepID=A0A444V067_ACIRT|nr:hypothetical protein EOD39_18714 [Acipenser ruthenus]